MRSVLTDFMQNAYVFLWAALAVITFILGFKYHKSMFLMSLFFVFMTVWYALRAFWGLPVFDGVLGYVFRGVLLAFLAAVVFVWWKGRRSGKRSGKQDNADKEEEE